jgi:enamine deaminase RidA (YjgF/YER057c/UK114 family)
MRIVNPPTLAPPRGYNNGVALPAPPGASVLFVAGQVGWDAEGRLTADGLTGQFERAIANVVAVVTSAGGAVESIGKLTIFVTDRVEYLAERRAIGAAYRRHMGRHFPAMTLVEVKALLEPGAKVEIEAIAVV